MGPPGEAAERGAALADCLSTRVLENIASLTGRGVLRGRPMPSRASRRRRFPRVEFYGEEPMKGGLPGHRHRWLELATVIDGKLNIGIGEHVYQARRGDWLAFGSNVLHGECCLSSRASYRLFWFMLNKPYLGVHLTRYGRRRGYELIASARFDGVPVELRSGFGRLCGGSWSRLVEARKRLIHLVGWCLDRLDAHSEGAAARPHPLVAEVKGILAESFEDPPSVVALAKQVGLSPNYLSNLFHRETGMTIRRFVETRRIEFARKLLLDPKLSVKQIAYASGFADPYHFSHAFRRVQGVSPTLYRRRAAEVSDIQS